MMWDERAGGRFLADKGLGGPEDSCIIRLENNHLHDLLLLIARGGMYLRQEIMSS